VDIVHSPLFDVTLVSGLAISGLAYSANSIPTDRTDPAQIQQHSLAGQLFNSHFPARDTEIMDDHQNGHGDFGSQSRHQQHGLDGKDVTPNTTSYNEAPTPRAGSPSTNRLSRTLNGLITRIPLRRVSKRHPLHREDIPPVAVSQSCAWRVSWLLECAYRIRIV
jgi:hypothetical protein